MSELSCWDHCKIRDYIYEITWTYNYGEPYFYLNHPGYIWEIDYEDMGKFSTFEKAQLGFVKILKEKIWDEICWHRDPENREDRNNGTFGSFEASPFDLDTLDAYQNEVAQIVKELETK